MITDIHSHIVFGVDDGACNLAQSRAMLNRAASAGIDEIVATPHVKICKPLDFSLFNQNFEVVKREAEAVNITLRKGYEISYYSLSQEGIENAGRFVIEGTSLLLLEMPFFEPLPDHWLCVINRLLSKSITPILVHPERTVEFRENSGLIKQARDMGCLVQVTAGDVGDGVIRRWMKQHLVDFLGFDAHRECDYQHAAKIIHKFPSFFEFSSRSSD